MFFFPRGKIFFTAVGLLAFFVMGSLSFLLFIPPSQSPSAKTILIKRGTPLKKISEMLYRDGVIRNGRFFLLLVTALGKKSEIKAGEYELTTSMRPMDVVEHLVSGQVKRHLVTIAEGFTVMQVSELLDNLGIVEKGAFLEKTKSPLLIASLGLSDIAGQTLEGCLFPETYHLVKEMAPEEVIRIMVHQFKKIFSSDLLEQASRVGLTGKEIVVLASIIEKETSLAEEKSLVSAVFHNRLKKKMPLQSDPTVIYGIKDFNGNLTRADLLKPTPYNTYLLTGLPPTAICNPGRESLLAALHPADAPYLYFVSKNDGSHFFSKDLDGHNLAVAKYQRSPRRRTSENPRSR
jgi:UPF0755 protein